jgi:hypothetical protein
MKFEFSRQVFEKKLKYQISSKSVMWEPSCSMWTDMTKLIFAFRKFANPPNDVSNVVGNVGNEALHNADCS